MNRRHFFQTLAGGVAAVFAKPKLWIWKSAQPGPSISLDEINRVTLAQVMPAIRDDYFKASPLLAYLREGLPERPPLPPPTTEQSWEDAYRRSSDESFDGEEDY